MLWTSDPGHAVYAQHYAGDIGRLVGSQKGKRVGNVLRLAQPAQRDLLDQGFDDLRGSMTSLGTAFIMSVSVMPGATALTRIPLGPSSRARDMVSPLTANLDAG